jgi:hypothetical protein
VGHADRAEGVRKSGELVDVLDQIFTAERPTPLDASPHGNKHFLGPRVIDAFAPVPRSGILPGVISGG